ncbi:Transformation transcription protein [Caenorhabditis elegans]|uniref:Transformation transcription protein n=1 Tax=Caenorhabditis elegans TaxID=6239 RepID=Q22514_CAEEL|nr:Transformation transcription protein [Caenorhabditis elegans]CAA91808.2 Transformation transcription protein [Caenorhabditis elegans]
MDQSFLKLEKPQFDLPARQVKVFEEVIEIFEINCCEMHKEQRQKYAQSARSVLRFLKFQWNAKQSVRMNKVPLHLHNNVIYHQFALVLAQWCQRLSLIQECFEAIHGYELLSMKMPPGSHEVSRRQLKMHFKTAIIAYMELSSFDHRLQPLTPTFLFFMGHIIEKCRNHPNPAVYHMVSLFIEFTIRDANIQRSA